MLQLASRLLLALGLACVVNAPTIARAATGDAHTFTFRIAAEPMTLDWNKAHTVVENYLLTNLMEGLLTLDEDLKVVPALAESYQRSKDGLTYTFKLRPRVKWSDGVPLRASDFLYSWQRLLSPSTAASYAYLLYDIVNAEAFYKGQVKDFSQVGIQAPDDSTLVVKLAKPVAFWNFIPTFWVTYPMRKDLVEKYGAAWTRPGKMVTVGPYVLKEHETDSRLVFVPNPEYYGKRGNVQEVIAQIVKDDSTALTLYEAGKIDYMTDLPALDLQRLDGRADLKAFPYLKTGYLGFSINVAGVDQAGVRRAIARAIDRRKFAGLLRGHQEPGTSFVPPRMLGHDDRIGLAFDPVKARAEFQAAGGKPGLAVTLVIPNTERTATLAQFLQSELKRVLGIQVAVQPYDHKTFRSQLTLNQYGMFLLSWSADYPDPDNFLGLWTGDSGNNRTKWKNARYDELIQKAKLSLSTQERTRLYDEAQKILVEQDAPIIPLYYEPQMALVSARVHGFRLSPVNYFYIRNVNLGGS